MARGWNVSVGSMARKPSSPVFSRSIHTRALESARISASFSTGNGSSLPPRAATHVIAGGRGGSGAAGGAAASSLEARGKVELPEPALARPVVRVDESHFGDQEAHQVHTHRGAEARERIAA